MADIRITRNLDEGESIGLEKGGRHILVCKIAGKYHATSNICSHARVELSDGRLRGTVITCPLHGARFDVTTGKCLGGPAFQDIESYQVLDDGDDLIIVTD